MWGKTRIGSVTVAVLAALFLSSCPMPVETPLLKNVQETVSAYNQAQQGTPQINLKYGSTDIASGGTCYVGSTVAGTDKGCVFTIENKGTGNLTLTGSQKVEISDVTLFSLSAPPAISIIPAAGTTTFSISLLGSSGVGAKTATVTIKNSDRNKGTYSFTVTGEVTASVVPVTGVTLNKSATTIPISGTEQLTATIAPTNATNLNVSWSSDIPSVASVGLGGLVTAGSNAGTATITVTTADGGKTATCTVTVVVPVTGVTLNKSSTTILINGTEQLTATVAPANATNQNVTWSSNNTYVASVGSDGLVTAGGSGGSATITVTTVDSSKTAKCVVTVSTVLVQVTGITLNKSDTTIIAGGTEQLTATISPSGATNQKVTWTSNNPSSASVGAGGLVTAGLQPGTATITVTTVDVGKTATCTVHVQAALPSIITAAPSAITVSTATGGGTVTSSGGADVYDRGVCWSTSPNPTTADSPTPNGTGIGSFTCNLTGLAAGTLYYVRAYATNLSGTAYGNEVSFTTRYTVTYDGNGNTGGSAPVDLLTYTQGQTVTVLGNSGNLVLPGYDLASWNTLADGSGTSYPAPFVGQTFFMGSVNVTLHAQWVLAPAVWDKAVWDLSKWQ